MTISALNGFSKAERLSRSIELYRDLSDALRQRVSILTSDSFDDAGCQRSVEAVRAHFKALQAVLDLEENLATHRSVETEGGVRELDLDAARAEVSSRLSVWLASKQD